MSPARAAFTLLEICLTLAIGVVLILLAVPSVSGLLAGQRLHESYDRFEQFANGARSRSLREQKPFLLYWEKDGIALLSAARDMHGERTVVDRLNFAKDEVFALERPAALMKKPPEEWYFWPSGVCEPVIVSYKGHGGSWRVSFNPLTSHGTFLDSEAL